MKKKSDDEFEEGTISEDTDVMREWMDWQANEVNSNSDAPYDLLFEADNLDLVDAFDYDECHHDSLFDEPNRKKGRK